MATALYRRYRPETFADVIGQDHVTTPLMRALRSGRVGHAYLFSGPRGCGKTTSARILARCLNCAQGPTDTPCGQCDSCRDLARGGPGSLDVVEIDAASHGGVDDARELRERATFAPARDRFKVFIIDEAHMVTSAGFNALLKLVEEPPEHVKFVFATTEPDKVIGTIRSRTHHYPFRLIPPQVLTPYLQQVCAAEEVPVGEGVLPLVVRAGGGSARDTLSVLDQLMAGAGEDGLDHATALALLGFTDTELLERAIDAISRRDAPSMFALTEQVIASGQEPRRFVEDLLERLRDLIVLAAAPDRAEDLLPQQPADELARLRDAVQGFEPVDLSRCGDLVNETLTGMSGATSPRLHLELLAARLVLRDERAAGADQVPAVRPAMGGGGAPVSGRERVRQAQQQAQAQQAQQAERARAPQQGQESQAPQRPPVAQDQRPRPDQGAAAASAPAPAPATAPADDDWGPVAPIGGGGPVEQAGQEDADRAAPMHGGIAPEPRAAERGSVQPGAVESDGMQTDAAGTAPEPRAAEPGAPGSAAPQAGAGPDAQTVRGHWSAIMDELHQIRRASWALINQNAHVQDVRGGTLVIGFPSEGLVRAFQRGTTAQNLADSVRRVMHLELAVEAVVGEDPGEGGSALRGGGSGGPGSSGSSGGSGGPGGPTGGPTGGPARGPAQDRSGQGQPPQGRHPQGRPAAGPVGGEHGGRAESAPSRGEGMSRGPAMRGTRAEQEPQDLPPEPEDPYPPEPEDAYPPDPQDDPAPHRGAGAPSPRAAAYGQARAGIAPDPDVEPAPGPRPAPERESAGQAASPVVVPEPLVIPDDARDDLPADQPRTHGQEALRRAIETGRPVRTAPWEGTGPEGSAPEGSEPEGSAPEGSAPEASEPDLTSSAAAPSSPGSATPGPAPAHTAPPAPAEPAPSHPAPSGAALVREAAHAYRERASRGGPHPGGRPGRPAPSAPPAPTEDEDPTGGARRDDEDVPRTTVQRPQEIVERLLGGVVLEVIDESR